MNAHRRNGVQALLRIGYRRNSKGGTVSIHHCSVMIALLSLCLTAPGQLAAQSHQDSGTGMNQTESAVPGLHDFDFLVGQWQAHHRKLKQRLANNHEWVEFEGTLLNQPLMGSYSNVDDTVLSVPDAPYRGVALRSFDPKTQQWSIWWLDSRTPSAPLDPPMIGGFHNGVGTFYGDDTVKGKRVRARFIWSNITPTSGPGSKRIRQTRARLGRLTGCRTSHEFADRTLLLLFAYSYRHRGPSARHHDLIHCSSQNGIPS